MKIWKFSKWDKTNNIVFVSIKRNYKKSIQQYNEFNKSIIWKLDTIFRNSDNSKTSDPRRLSLNLTDKIDLRRKDKYIALSNVSVYYTWKNIKSHIRIINLKFQLQNWIKNLNYLTDYILYQIFKVILNRYIY